MKYVFQELNKHRMYYFCLVIPSTNESEQTQEWFIRSPPRHREFYGYSESGTVPSLEYRLDCPNHKLIMIME